uniref:Jacalin-type lectin domain-containing protein n=1 Tax=Attheya septentrionalis TaxID=420275 RepID=A0A7S2UI17_9STRA|mmetsp:Transcript_26464/g.48011  ORF Transcript_26464/g.48011 Transcript_26464/m.48011 type:complete len:380 (+) Transcript_26464:142-1281(+)
MIMELMGRILKLLLVLACLTSIEAAKRTYQANEKYDLTAISLNATVNAFIDIPFGDSKVGTTEFMVLSKSNGNANDKFKHIAEVQGGGWNEVVYGGDDDRCIHIFERFVTTSNQMIVGKINTKGGAIKSALIRVVFDGKVEPGEKSGRRIENEKMTFTAETEGCYFFAYGGDNGGVSKDSDTNIIYKDDDPTSLYFGYGTSFTDESFFSLPRPRRGAVAGVQLTNRPDICSGTQTTKKKEEKKEKELPTREKIKDADKPVIEDASIDLEEDTVNKSTLSNMYRMGESFLPILILLILGGVFLCIVVSVVCGCPAKMDVQGTDGPTTLYGLHLKKKKANEKIMNAEDASTISSGGDIAFQNETKENYNEFEECREFEEYP